MYWDERKKQLDRTFSFCSTETTVAPCRLYWFHTEIRNTLGKPNHMRVDLGAETEKSNRYYHRNKYEWSNRTQNITSLSNESQLIFNTTRRIHTHSYTHTHTHTDDFKYGPTGQSSRPAHRTTIVSSRKIVGFGCIWISFVCFSFVHCLECELWTL